MTAVTTKGKAHPPDALDCYLKFICLVFMVINTCFYIMLVEGLADFWSVKFCRACIISISKNVVKMNMDE